MDLKDEFKLVEYKETAAAYFKGVEIGISFIKLYLLINGALLGAMAFSNSSSPGIANDLGVGAYLNQIGLTHITPWVGLLFSILLFGIVPFYRNQLNGCSSRCAEIERELEGKLFSKIQSVSSENQQYVSAVGAIYWFAILGGGLWIFILAYRWQFDPSVVWRLFMR
jgi:hypothetical protein